ncbi:MAG: hypothetical protein ACLS70_01815, partial [[Clostridium] symbiosum]
PIDGVVVSYNDISFSKSCGRTEHHYKDGLAYKFEDEMFESRLQLIEWTPTRSGEIAPVAVFDTVEIDGCEVSRASLHNLSFIEALEFMPGNRLLVSKHNMIIPHIEENIDRGGFALERIMPRDCPCAPATASMKARAELRTEKNGLSRLFSVIILPVRHGDCGSSSILSARKQWILKVFPRLHLKS